MTKTADTAVPSLPPDDTPPRPPRRLPGWSPLVSFGVVRNPTGIVAMDECGQARMVGDEAEWRVVLPTGLNFSPVGFVASAIAQADVEDVDSEIDAPPRMRPYVQQTLARMGEVSIEEYYSLCGRLDTLEHVHEVLVAVAAKMMGDTDDGADAPEPTADEPSGPVN